MNFCTGCGKAIHESAPVCPQCGAPQKPVAVQPAQVERTGPLWMAITSLVLGVWCALSIFEDIEVDDAGLEALAYGVQAAVSAIGLALGIVSLNVSKRGKGMAIAGIVTSAVGLLAAIP